jgi:hypothetical protein
MPRPVQAGTDQRGWRLPLPAAAPGAGVVEILLARPAQAAPPPEPVAPVQPAPQPAPEPVAAAPAAADPVPAPAADPAPVQTAALAPVAPAEPVAPAPQAAPPADPIAALLNNPAAAGGWIDPDAGAPTQVAGLPASAPTLPASAPTLPVIVAVPAGRFAAQIAAVTSPQEAQAEWARFQRRFPDLFGALQLAVPQVSASTRLGYRVQAVPLDQATAARLCEALASEKTGCLVVPR